MEESAVRKEVATFLDAAWSELGHAVPHLGMYPFQWLWDSCFHALVWAALGDERAVPELDSIFRYQGPTGFVPHVTYDGAPDIHADLWGRRGTSSITHPPMYGHAVAELTRRGVEVPVATIERASLGLRFLLERRARVDDLVTIVHPWESGCDDSPRWDDWFSPVWEAKTWFRRKGELVASIEYDGDGAPVANPAFSVASAGFNALVAFNAHELASVTGDERLLAAAAALVDALESRWSASLATWVDGERGSGSVRTLDALLGHLLVDRPLPSSLFESDGYGAPFGPTGVHVAEHSFSPRSYWRGSTWPQLLYLLVLAAERRGDDTTGGRLRAALRAGAVASGFAEHWDPTSGDGLGPRPQGWTGLTVVVPPSP